MAQQCQSSTTIMGQSAAGEGATVDMAKHGPTVMASADERKQRSNRLPARVPSWSDRGALSHDVKMTSPPGAAGEPSPSEGFDSRPRARRARDDSGYVCYMAEARATLPRYPRTFPRPAGVIL
jgi:hypothetical protein